MGAGPEHLGTGPWGVVEEPVELAQPPWSQAVVVMGALGQVGRSPVDAAATAAVAASRAAPGERQKGMREASKAPNKKNKQNKNQKPASATNTSTRWKLGGHKGKRNGRESQKVTHG